MLLTSKLPNTGTTIFTTMSALAQEYNAINLGQGFPDFPMDHRLIDLVSNAMRDNYNQYAPMPGHTGLRKTIAEKAGTIYNADIDPETEITITPGGTCAIYTALTAVLRQGDEVIVFQPAYDSYIPNVIINGATPILIDLKFPGYSIDWDEVRSKISARTRMILINSPHNPTGAVLTAADMQQLIDIMSDTDIYIMSDEVYEHLVYDGRSHESVLKYEALRKRSFAYYSFGKVYHCTGWKIGYCIAPAELMKEFRKVYQYNAFSTHTPSQVALSTFLADPATYRQTSVVLQQKRDYFQSLMENTGFESLPSYGSYFQLYKYGRISDEPEMDFATRLVKEYKVAAIPVSAFYNTATDHGVIRFCFAKKESTLEEAAKRLSRVSL